MKADAARDLGRVLFPVLSPFQELGGKDLCAVWYVHTETELTEVILDFGQVSLILKAVADDDTVDFSCNNTIDLDTAGWVDARKEDCWTELLGAQFGWGWITVNQQGYCDGVLLSFGGIEPNVLLYVMASRIKLRRFSANP